ncbi:MAG: hypothetical protein ACHQ7N_02835 [Candidatus Methylomirabilales bacterium]
MRRLSGPLTFRLWILVLAIGLAVPALARDRIGDVLARPEAFDGREVVLEGKASGVDPRTSRRGNDYFTFRLSDETGTSLKVFSWGKPAIAPGDRVEVHGRFQRERRVGRYVFTDEVEASRVRKLP